MDFFNGINVDDEEGDREDKAVSVSSDEEDRVA